MTAEGALTEAGARIAVLLVDDHDVFRSATRLVLGLEPGFVVAGEAGSGEAAVRLAIDLNPSLVLMDVNLPGIDGIEATRRILANAPDTVIILLSAYATDDLPADAATCGAAAFVPKSEASPTGLRRLWQSRSRVEP